ncbi:MAG: succinyldiaminopimelate transaminase [Campylobacterales bacterium]|nr:succinyldiaminopimelate transaminase [Campylobacterales bacterium]
MNFETYPFEKLNHLLENIEPNDKYAPLSLTIGEPQFNTPYFIQEEFKNKATLLNKYPKSAGEDELMKSMLNYVKNRFEIELKPTQIISTFGTREVLFNFPQYLLHDNEHPQIAYTNPFYQIYEGAAKAVNANVIHLDLTKENNFKPDMEHDELWNCDLVIINFPNNPTASTLTMEELKKWVKLALKHDFVLLNDECYIDLYTQEAIPSLLNASIEVGNVNFKNIVVVNSISKRSSAPGLRSGFIAGDEEILKGYKLYRTYLGCASPLPLQYAAALAWDDDIHVDGFRDNYRKNFKVAQEVLGVEIPVSTFYIWMEVDDELRFTQELYEGYNIKVLPGSFLGRNGIGKGYIRLALVYEEPLMREALERIKKYMDRKENR